MARQTIASLKAELELANSKLATRDAEIANLNARLQKGFEMVRHLQQALASAEAKPQQRQARPDRAEFMAHAAEMKRRMEAAKAEAARTGKTVLVK